MHIPIATYRLQFSPQFGFRQAKETLDYLQMLGISDLYASPIFKSRKGSPHGYDVVDQNKLNPDLGRAEEFGSLTEDVQRRGMGWLQDIVPNHMALDSNNDLLLDVMENGPASRFAPYFDIEWRRPSGGRQVQILLPLLGQFYGRALEQGELILEHDEQGFAIRYYDLKFPLRIVSYRQVLTHCLKALQENFGEEHPDSVQLKSLSYLLGNLRTGTEGEASREQATLLKQNLWILYQKSDALQKTLKATLKTFNGQRGRAKSFNRLERLLASQWFRLAFWKVATEEINYRRFFCINELISLRMEHPEAFAYVHQLPLALLDEAKLTGLRIDHIDGLRDPRGYLEHLREQAQTHYIVVEKILAPSENLPDWPVQGTTGYDFLNTVNALFCRPINAKAMSATYTRFTRKRVDYLDMVLEKKGLILDKHMAGDVANLVLHLRKLASHNRYGSDLTYHGLYSALTEIMVRLPVYRTYLSPNGKSPEDLKSLGQALRQARERNPGRVNEINFIEKVLQLNYDEFLGPKQRSEWHQFSMRFQQFTGPLTAKGFEDTLLYSFNRMLSLNEVGGSPDRFGLEEGEFHRFCSGRQQFWPLSMNTTSTHDTKRGEDVRARLNVLSEIPRQWREHVREWSQTNRPLKRSVGRRKVPDKNDEYFLYQTLVGAWPSGPKGIQSFKERLSEYLVKAVREAKVHTAWIKPDKAYEEAFVAFAQTLFDPKHPFLRQFLPFQRKIAFFGMLNSLSQVLIKVTAPGIPDFYQGSELWDLNLVDPDNRRVVDFAIRNRMLTAIMDEFEANPRGLIKILPQTWLDGRIKMFLTQRALAVRRRLHDLFEQGEYCAVPLEGQHAEHLVVFARTLGQSCAVTVAPRFLTGLVEEDHFPLGPDFWGQTILNLPVDTEWEEAITGKQLGRTKRLTISEVLVEFPVGLLVSKIG